MWLKKRTANVVVNNYICLVAEIGDSIAKAKQLLIHGDLVAVPTETVYGLAANALNPLAVAKIFEAKQRPTFDPLIVHTYSADKVWEYVTEIHPLLSKLAKHVWPGPLTLLLPKKSIIPDIVTSGLERVGVRVPNHPTTLSLLQQLDFPLAAPSANPFGYISPTSPQHVEKQLGDKVAYILDGGTCEIGLESTIVGEENGHIIIYRLGGLSIEEVENCIGQNVKVQLNQSSNPKAPGQLKSHYAPRKPFVLGDFKSLLSIYSNKKIGVLTFGYSDFEQSSIYLEKNLSPSADFKEAAICLYSHLRELDESDAEIIIAQSIPDIDLGRAINDRLRRAASLR